MDRFRKNCSEYSSIIVIALVAVCFLLIRDPGTTAALRWLAVVFSVSFFMRPFVRFVKLSLPFEGFSLRIGAGLFLCFFPAWTFCSVFSVEYADAAVFTSSAVMIAAGYLINRYVIKEPYVTKKALMDNLKGFAAFAVIFLVWFWIIGFNPVVDSGTENFMDFGFLQMIYRQKAAVPTDIWFSGSLLTYYYYLGQAVTVFMCRLALTVPEYGYNMMLATFIACVFLMVYELASGIASVLLADDARKLLCARAGGLAAAILAAVGANPHWLVFGVLAGTLKKIFGTSDSIGYWFPDGTVYIGIEFGDPDNGKSEFPAYSVILGDLHAHVVNLIFVLPLLALLFDMCLAPQKEERRGYIWKLVLISMLLGYYKGSNYWDFAIYFVITGAVIVFTDIAREGFSKRAAVLIAVKAATVTAVSYIAPLAFTLRFAKMESGIKVADVHSPPEKFLVLWLLPVLLAVWLVAFLASDTGKKITDKAAGCGIIALSLCTIGLIIVPEVVYVVDIYGEGSKRFNTMFKLAYQAFVLFSIIAGIVFATFLYRAFTDKVNSGLYKGAAATLGIIVILSASYTPYAVHQWFGNVLDGPERRGISSLEGLRGDPTYGFEMEAYDVLAADRRQYINIIEAAGNSYNHESALSVYSGTCAPVGWFVHEWMWHNDSQPVAERADRVAYFYQSGDSTYCKDFIKLYDIDYIFVGPAEVCKYPVNRDGFWDLGDICVSTSWQGVDLALIKVDRSKCM